MLFDIKTAIALRKHYKDILINTPLTRDSSYLISGLFICRKGEVNKAINVLLSSNFDERYPLLAGDETQKDFEIYVYYDDGANIVYDELDANLTEKEIPKIY